MLFPAATLRVYDNKGYGIYTTQKIPAGSIVWVPCKDCITYRNEDLKTLNEEEARFVLDKAYYMENGDLLMPCSISRFMNHSCDANTLSYGLDFAVAIRDIEANEEICSDYRFAYLDRPNRMKCYCQSPSCVGEISPDLGRDERLHKVWAEKVRNVFDKIKTVDQPLHEVCLDCSAIYEDIINNKMSYLDVVATCLSPKYLVYLSSRALYDRLVHNNQTEYA